MAKQTPRSTDPPPIVPALPAGNDTLVGYLRNFAKWCADSFADKLSGATAQPGLLLQAYDAAANVTPPVYLLEVTSAGRLDLARIPLGSGVMGAPVPVARTGVVDGSSAPAGSIGESLTASGSAASIASNTYTNLASIVLPPGDWDVTGRIAINVTPSSNNIQGGFTGTSGGTAQHFIQAGPTMTNIGVAVGPTRVLAAVATTLYLTGFAIYTPGSCNGSGTMSARRMR